MSDEATQAAAAAAAAQTGQDDPPKEEVPAEGEQAAKPSEEVVQGTNGDETPPATEEPAASPATTDKEDPDDIESVVQEREEANTPPSRAQKVSANRWDTAMGEDGQLNPKLILEYSQDSLLQKTMEEKAKGWGYDSAQAMLDTAKEATSTPEGTPAPASTSPPNADGVTPEDLQFIRQQREAQATKDEEAGVQALRDEDKEYKEWEPEAFKSLEKPYGVSEADFKANHLTEFRQLRNAEILKGRPSVEAGKTALNAIKVKIHEGEVEGTKQEPKGGDMPAKPSEATKGEDAPVLPLIQRAKYHELDQDGKVAYLKQHKVDGVVQYAPE